MTARALHSGGDKRYYMACLDLTRTRGPGGRRGLGRAREDPRPARRRRPGHGRRAGRVGAGCCARPETARGADPRLLPRLRSRRTLPRRRSHVGHRGERASVRRRRRPRDALQRRRRARALQLYSPGRPPRRPDRRRNLDRRRVTRARAATPRRHRAAGHARARPARQAAPRPPSVGEGPLSDLRGAARLLPAARPGAPG